MSARRTLAVARRIVEGFRRDRRTLGLIFVVPIVVMALVGWVIRDEAAPTNRLLVVNEAGSAGAQLEAALREAAGRLDPALGVRLVDDAADASTARLRIRDGAADVALVLPSGLASAVAAGRPPTIRVITAGTDPIADGSRLAVLQRLLAGAAIGALPGGARGLTPELVHETVYLTPDADTVDVLAPVFLAFFCYFFVFILTGISFLRERIGGTLERLLATPVTRGEIVIGYGLGFGLFATLQVAVLIAFVLGRVDVPAVGPLPSFWIGLGVGSAGSPLLSFLVAVLLALGAVNLGIFLSTFAGTELQVIQFIPIVIVPQGLLSGIFWPIDRLPGVLQPIAHVLPVTYAVDALREVMLKGADLASGSVQLDLAVLLGVALVFVVLATRTIKREVA